MIPRIISNCPLCGEKGLHVIGDEGTMKTQQCINCGYATSDKFKGGKEDNEMYKTLPEDMKSWTKEEGDFLWIPSMITLPFGTLYPTKVDEEMKWACAVMVDIPESERENYPNPQGGYFTQRYDTENQTVFDVFLEALSYMNEKAKENAETEPEVKEIKLPKLKNLSNKDG